MKNLENKTAFITGGSRGIGAAIALKLASKGANVVITYQSSVQKANDLVAKIIKLGGHAIALKADSAEPQQITDAIDAAFQKYGSMDILINNAGIGLYNDISNFTLSDFDNIISVNVKAVFVSTQHALKYLKPGGRIINIGSCQAGRMPTLGGALYAMSKAALVALTKGVARDVGLKGITANIVSPGPIDTDMNPANGPFADYQRSLMALPDFGKPDDVAQLVAWIASAESGNITGAEFLTDGGTNI